MRKLYSAIAMIATVTLVLAVGTIATEAVASNSSSSSPTKSAGVRTVRTQPPFPFNHASHAAQAVFMVKPLTNERQMVRSGGTGFLVRLNGSNYILTNRHVCQVETLDQFLLVQQGLQVYTVRIIAVSNRADLCLIAAPTELVRSRTPYTLSTRPLLMNERLATFGHPLMRPLTAAFGHFVNITREPINIDYIFDKNFVMVIGRVDYPVQPGNSGSPVIDVDNNVVGVIFAFEGAALSGLFVPASEVQQFVDTME